MEQLDTIWQGMPMENKIEILGNPDFHNVCTFY